MKRVLLACPVSSYKDYILPTWINYIKDMKKVYPFDVLLVDNSPDKNHVRKISKLINAPVLYRKQYKNETLAETMAACNNIINLYLQQKQYDYLFSLECDIFPPIDTLKRLLAYEKQIVSATYNIGFASNRSLILQDFVFGTDNQIKIVNVSKEQGFNIIDGTLQQVPACGLGCILIKSEVLKNYKFRVDPAYKVHADTFFHFDMYNRQIPVYMDTGIFCTHVNSHWNQINKKNEHKVRH